MLLLQLRQLLRGGPQRLLLGAQLRQLLFRLRLDVARLLKGLLLQLGLAHGQPLLALVQQPHARRVLGLVQPVQLAKFGHVRDDAALIGVRAQHVARLNQLRDLKLLLGNLKRQVQVVLGAIRINGIKLEEIGILAVQQPQKGHAVAPRRREVVHAHARIRRQPLAAPLEQRLLRSAVNLALIASQDELRGRRVQRRDLRGQNQTPNQTQNHPARG